MANIMTSSELQRINAISNKAITTCFKSKGFRFNHSDVEEAILMTHEKVARYWDSYDEEVSKSAWFYLLAWQAACDYMTDRTDYVFHHRGIKYITDDGEVYEVEFADRASPERYQPDFQLIVNEKLEAVEKEIDALGEMAGQALRLQAMGYSYAEIEDLLGSNANALKTMVSRGRSRVKKNLGFKKVA